MMKLYDDLYIGIPSNIRINSCVIGEKWVTVRSNGTVGMAKVLEKPTHDGAEFGGKWLRDIGGHLYWHDLTEAAVGVAALNAWYNSPEHIKMMNPWYDTDTHKKFYESLEKDDYSYCDGKKVAVVGDCPFFTLAGKTGDKFDLPFGEKIDEAKYGALKDYDVVIISADALTTKSMCALIEIIGEDGYVVVDGLAPAAQCFFAWDMPVKRINGYFQRFDYTMEDAARLNLDDINPGVYSFSIDKFPADFFYHEQEAATNFLNGPYRASEFNPKFTYDWKGKEYNHDEWDPLFKG